MGAFNDLIKMMLRDNNLDDEKTLEVIDAKGKKDADKIAEELGQKEDKKSFVPKVDVPPVELPEKAEKEEAANEREGK